MHDQSDAQLLRNYADHGAEAAFAEIVARHTDLVYSAALRHAYSPDHARDVTQSVFTDLARKARIVSSNLSSGASLVGWLYRSTRFAARDLYRNETRRIQRERQAMEQLHPMQETPPDWEQLRPILDDAMAELDDIDRDAVLLRYFKNQDLRTVGATLGVRDDAAQKRVSRAVERLRKSFARRGVAVGASGLTVAIAANAVQAAPVGLALTISSSAVLTGTTLTTATVTTTKAIAMTALQKTVVTATIAILAGAGIYEARQASQLRTQVQTLAPLAASLDEEAAKNKQRDMELQRLRDLVGQLREDNAALEKRLIENRPVGAPAQPPNKTPEELSLNYLPRESWAFAGYANPESAFRSYAWASGNGDVKTMLASVTPEEHARMMKQFEGKSDDEIIAALEADMEAIKSFRILKKEAVSENEAVLTIFGEGKDKDKTVKLRFQQTENGWKLAGPVGRKAK